VASGRTAKTAANQQKNKAWERFSYGSGESFSGFQHLIERGGFANPEMQFAD
jgi:hypothetical protein